MIGLGSDKKYLSMSFAWFLAQFLEAIWNVCRLERRKVNLGGDVQDVHVCKHLQILLLFSRSINLTAKTIIVVIMVKTLAHIKWQHLEYVLSKGLMLRKKMPFDRLAYTKRSVQNIRTMNMWDAKYNQTSQPGWSRWPWQWSQPGCAMATIATSRTTWPPTQPASLGPTSPTLTPPVSFGNLRLDCIVT